MRKWAAIAWAGWCLAGIGWADEATTAWLAEYPAKLDVLQTVREKGELRIEMAIGGMTHLPEETWWKAARLAPLTEQGVSYIKPWLPDDLSKHIAFADTINQMAPQLAPQLLLIK